MKIYFFIGKGGAGKSTLSSLTALYLASQDRKVLLSSLDPAHNLSDIFEKDFSDKPIEIISGLLGIEVDHEKWIRSFLKQSEDQLKKSYAYLTSFSMDKHFSVMQHAPALQEYALQQAFISLIEKYSSQDVLIFDMPPTALTLKFFALPQLSLLWLENLQKLRSEIIKKQQVISKLSLGTKTFERDRVTQNINNQQVFWQKIDKLLKDPNVTHPVVVENPDPLSMAETHRITEKMADLAIASPAKALNNAPDNKVKGYRLVVPKMNDMTGMDNLLKAIEQIDFSGLLDKVY